MSATELRHRTKCLISEVDRLTAEAKKWRVKYDKVCGQYEDDVFGQAEKIDRLNAEVKRLRKRMEEHRKGELSALRTVEKLAIEREELLAKLDSWQTAASEHGLPE